MFRSVNVNVAVAGVCVFLIQAVEPENSGGNKIFGVGQRVIWAECHARFENCPRRGAISDFFRDPKTTKRRLHAAFLSPDSKTGTGNCVSMNEFPVTSQGQALILD